MKEMFLDICALGWSLYLSAHMRWLKKKGHASAVMVLPGREALYKNIASSVHGVPSRFFVDFNMSRQNRFTIDGASGEKLRRYFNSRLPKDYLISGTQPFDCHIYKRIYVGKMLFESYLYETRLEGKEEILVFPRKRKVDKRNLPKAFYILLVDWLCRAFENYTVRTMGTPWGAYDITEVSQVNYVNSVGQTSDLQSLIDRCQLAVGAVGSQSAPLKLMLLQGVPTFMIGHEKNRHVEEENWMETKVGFYETSSYSDFAFEKCIAEIISFMGRSSLYER